MKAIINFEGESVALGPLSQDYLDVYVKCNNDFTITRTLGSSKPSSRNANATSIDQFSSNSNYVFFTIFEKQSFRPIGFTYLENINHLNRTATFNIVIGEKDCLGKGYGTETTKLMMNYAFSVLGIHNLDLNVFEFNKGAIRAYEKCGFVEYGRRRQAHFLGGKLWDIIYMECLSNEFEGFVKEWDF